MVAGGCECSETPGGSGECIPGGNENHHIRDPRSVNHVIALDRERRVESADTEGCGFHLTKRVPAGSEKP